MEYQQGPSKGLALLLAPDILVSFGGNNFEGEKQLVNCLRKLRFSSLSRVMFPLVSTFIVSGEGIADQTMTEEEKSRNIHNDCSWQG